MCGILLNVLLECMKMKVSKFELVVCWLFNLLYWPIVIGGTVYSVLWVVEYFGLLELVK